MLGAMLLDAGSYAFRRWEQCSWRPKAMPYGFQSNDIATRKACFQHPEAGLLRFSHLPLGATGVGLHLPPLGATTLARDSPPSEGAGEVLLHHHLLPIKDVDALRELEGHALFA